MDATMDFKAALLTRQPSAAGYNAPKPTTANVSAVGHGNNSFTATGEEEKRNLMKVRSACIPPGLRLRLTRPRDAAHAHALPQPHARVRQP
jgi:hypothetical protein